MLLTFDACAKDTVQPEPRLSRQGRQRREVLGSRLDSSNSSVFIRLTRVTKYRRHADPKGRNYQNEMKRYKGLNYFKQNCPMSRFTRVA